MYDLRVQNSHKYGHETSESPSSRIHGHNDVGPILIHDHEAEDRDKVR